MRSFPVLVLELYVLVLETIVIGPTASSPACFIITLIGLLLIAP